MLDIAVYSMHYSPRVLRELPYVEYFVERGLTHLAGLRGSRDRLIVLTSRPVVQDVLSYHLREVCGMSEAEEAAARGRLTLMTAGPAENASLAEALCSDAAAMARLRREVEGADRARLHMFAADPSGEELGRRLGVPLSEPSTDLARYWGSKAGGKEAFRLAGVPTARCEPSLCRSADEVAVAALRLARGPGAPERIMVKLNGPEWGDAIGNMVVDTAELVRTGDIGRSIDTILQPWPDFSSEIAAEGAVVEEFLADAECSPSGQGIITPDGEVRVVSSHQQIVRSGQYVGCEFPAPERFVDQIREAVERTGRVLAERGMRGSFGIDFIGRRDGSLVAVEINARKVATSHVLDTVEAAARARLGADGRTPSGPVRYVHRRLHADEMRSLSPGEAVALLRRAGLLYDRARGTGVLLHILGALPEHGYVEATAVHRTREQAVAVLADAESLLLTTAAPGKKALNRLAP
ncbi:ATP-grasp domain-containing protein [Actinomadura soli]|uniref:ATP-grasp domain-containing protein n=1 Tax=Actinomadura soli TaxID=2508997 RepID=A0A5C4JGN6_9ACTN|nr:peptide ligase PGM1-related protein [Actinomadura soli]TMR05005.1 ATP-grasp domain-containing protein [Actinomadura soli]